MPYYFSSGKRSSWPKGPEILLVSLFKWELMSLCAAESYVSLCNLELWWPVQLRAMSPCATENYESLQQNYVSLCIWELWWSVQLRDLCATELWHHATQSYLIIQSYRQYHNSMLLADLHKYFEWVYKLILLWNRKSKPGLVCRHGMSYTKPLAIFWQPCCEVVENVLSLYTESMILS